ncbi:flippase [Candidatus Peregrinibacteria bacterium]|nr:flippase [Candidatus Peregrinibacteria bacterium]
MSTARKIISNTLAQIIGKLLVTIIGLATVKMTTHYLSVKGYGEYTAVYEFLAFFGIAADLGFFTIGVKEMSQNEEKIPIIIGNILSLRTISVIFTMIVAVVLGFLIPKYQGTRIPLGIAISSLTVFYTIMNGTITSVLQVKMKMHLASIATIAGKIITVLFMAYVIFYGYPDDKETGFNMLMAAGVIGCAAMHYGTNYFVRKITPLKHRFDIAIWKELITKSLPYGIALILSTIYFRMNSILISLLRNQEELGIYGVASKLLEQFTIIPLYFMNSVLPVLAKSIKHATKSRSEPQGEQNKHSENLDSTEAIIKYKTIIRYSFDFLAAMSAPMVVGAYILAYPIIFIISTPEFMSRLNEGFYGSDIALKILIFALLFQFINILFAFILIAANKQGKLLYINGACVILNITINLFLIPRYGFVGACITYVFSEFFILVAVAMTARRCVEFSLNFKNLLKIFFCAGIMGATVYFLQPFTYKYLQNWNVFLLAALGGAIYVAMLFATKVVDKDMLKLIRRGEDTPEPSDISSTKNL